MKQAFKLQGAWMPLKLWDGFFMILKPPHWAPSLAPHVTIAQDNSLSSASIFSEAVVIDQANRLVSLAVVAK